MKQGTFCALLQDKLSELNGVKTKEAKVVQCQRRCDSF